MKPMDSMLNQGFYGPSSLPGMSTMNDDSNNNSSSSSNLSNNNLFNNFGSSNSSMASLNPNPPSNSDEHMMGTSIMAVSFAGGVVMGADSRTSTGNYVANRVSDKISPVHDRIYCCRSGSAADTQAVSDMVKYYLNAHAIELGKLPQVKTAAHLFQEICYNNKDRLLAGIIIGGYDDVVGDGSVYALPLGGTLVKQPFAIGGSGSTYIYGYVDANYKVGMTKEACQNFVKTALSHAMARDGHSGGVIRMTTITKDKVERVMVPGDKLPYLPEKNV
jgi:20S proteasome subunit beta 1